MRREEARLEAEAREAAKRAAATATATAAGAPSAAAAAAAVPAVPMVLDLDDVRRLAKLRQSREEKTAARDELIEQQRQRFIEVWSRKLQRAVVRGEELRLLEADGASEDEWLATQQKQWGWASSEFSQLTQRLEGWGVLMSSGDNQRPTPWANAAPRNPAKVRPRR